MRRRTPGRCRVVAAAAIAITITMVTAAAGPAAAANPQPIATWRSIMPSLSLRLIPPRGWTTSLRCGNRSAAQRSSGWGSPFTARPSSSP